MGFDFEGPSPRRRVSSVDQEEGTASGSAAIETDGGTKIKKHNPPPKFIRTLRYDYDFAPPQQTPVGQRGKVMLGKSKAGGGGGNRGWSSGLSPTSPGPQQGKLWWRRRYTDEYLPALSLDNASLKAYMIQQGFEWPGRYDRESDTRDGGGGGREGAWRRRLRGWPNGAVGAALGGILLTVVLIAVDLIATRVILEGFAAEDSVLNKDKVA